MASHEDEPLSHVTISVIPDVGSWDRSEERPTGSREKVTVIDPDRGTYHIFKFQSLAASIRFGRNYRRHTSQVTFWVGKSNTLDWTSKTKGAETYWSMCLSAIRKAMYKKWSDSHVYIVVLIIFIPNSVMCDSLVVIREFLKRDRNYQIFFLRILRQRFIRGIRESFCRECEITTNEEFHVTSVSGVV